MNKPFHFSSRAVLGACSVPAVLAASLVLRAPASLFGQDADPSRNGTPANFKVAFLGDQGLGRHAEAVLTLVKNEGARAVVHAGDFDYDDEPRKWDRQITRILGEDFPYFGVIGNHDEDEWEGSDGYQALLEARMRRIGIRWDGDLGVQASLHYGGIFFVETAPGIGDFDDRDFAGYLREQLASDQSIWSVAAWHKNMEDMQAGGKDDETGWGVYEAAREGGAIIATGHEHSYSRTYLLSNMEARTVASTSDTLTITKGRTFAFVSGLGGRSIRVQKRGGPWWARIYANECRSHDPVCEPDATYGALFGVFNADGIANRASFYFKNIDGRIVDRFTVVSNVEPIVTTTRAGRGR